MNAATTRVHTVLGLGSNCGDRLEYLRKAVQILKTPSPGIQVLAISPIYQSDALLPEGAQSSWNLPFLNLNLLCLTELSPRELLANVKGIEALLGRKQRGRWAPREIDIDILTYGDNKHFESDLQIPHSSLLARPFALLPLADLCSVTELSPQASDLVIQWRRGAPHSIPFSTKRSQICLTQLMGIINVTEDSFSDGGHFLNPELALNQANRLIAQGATVLDLGAESTRPGAKRVDSKTEWKRLEPILEPLLSQLKAAGRPIATSVDTRNVDVAIRAIRSGVHWINDVSGFENSEMRKAVMSSNVQVVAMHSLTIPPSQKDVLSFDQNPIDQLLQWADQRVKDLIRKGISRDRIIIDPGIGFGKTPSQTWEILRSMHRFNELGVRTLVGHSRKSFLASVTEHPAAERDIETCALSVELVSQGVDFIRVHNVDLNARAIQTWNQINGRVKCHNPTLI